MNPESHPPRWPDKLLEWFCAPHLLEEVLGDLHERYYLRAERLGEARARRYYWREVLTYMRPSVFRRESTFTTPIFTTCMLRNYLTIAFRNMIRQKIFAAINIMGLAIGLTACLLIVLFVRDELSYDRYHANANRLYRLCLKARMGGNDIQNAFVGIPAGPALVNDYSFVESATRLKGLGTYIVEYGDKRFKEEGVVFADPNFFETFSIPLLKGDLHTVLTQPNTVVLTEAIARKYFGPEDPVGRIITLGTDGPFTVTGVSKDVPANTHFHYTIFASLVTIDRNPDVKWLASGAHTYLLLAEGTRPETLEARNQEILRKYIAPEVQEFIGVNLDEFVQSGSYFGFFLQPIRDIHLYSDLEGEIEANGDIRYVYIFSLIAVFILALACINFMNLATASSAGRAKEIGIRKVLGSVRQQLIGQFLTESLVVTALAMLISLGLINLLIPAFNQLADKQVRLSSLGFGWLLGGSIGIVLLVGLLAGSYPAFLLSAFQPVQVLKGKLWSNAEGRGLRSVLVVFQFVISIGLIISTSVVYRQLSYIQNKKVGYDKEQVLVIQDTYVLETNSRAFKNELVRNSQITHASFAGYLPAGSSNDAAEGLHPEGSSDPQTTYRIRTYYVDEDYLPTLGIQLVQGRNFSAEFGTDSNAVLLNEAAVRQFGFSNPIGQRITSIGDGTPDSKQTYTVVGVVQDFHFESMRQRIAPLVMYYGQDTYQTALRVQTNDLPGLLASIEQTWKKYTHLPFSYSFLDDRFNHMYRAEQKTKQLFTAFTGLAILVACMGLFGLVAFTTSQRIKEIGIRKVLGASVMGILMLLTRDFLKLVFIAFILASALAWYAMSNWLEDFAYRINISAGIFITAGCIALLIALITVSYQAIKAALANPVNSLRNE